jgi:hypothetical protein
MLAEQKFALSAGFGGPKSEPTKVESERHSMGGKEHLGEEYNIRNKKIDWRARQQSRPAMVQRAS